MKKRILIVTDSLGLPREIPDKVNYENTYLYKLKSFFRQTFPEIEIISVSIGGGSINELSKQILGYYKATKPDLVIMQSGIVDCSPRMFKKSEIALLQIIPIIGKVTFKLARNFKTSIRKFRRITYTSPKEFERIAIELKEVFGDRIYWLGILPAREKYELLVPGISKNIKQYNDLIQKNYLAQFINLNNFPLKGISSDHHHLNEYGHQLIAQQLKSLLLSIFKIDV